MSPKLARATFARALLAGGAILAISACGKDKSITGTSTGTLQVTTASTGQDIDADGYTVSVDNGSTQAIDASATITINDLAAGSHTVTLGGLASNCTADKNPQTVTVEAGATAKVTFNVTCTATAAGSIHVTTTSSGEHLDPNGYSVAVDGGQAKVIGGSDTTTIAGVSAGSHTITLSGVASNCSVTQASTSVDVTANATAQVTFTVTCGARTLAFESDAAGNSDIYTIKEDGSGLKQITTDTTFEGFADYSPDGAKIAFTRFQGNNLDVWVMNADGSNQVRLTTDAAEDGVSSWSPDGTKIAFASTRGGNAQIWVMNADGSNQTQLTHMTEPGTGTDTAGVLDSLALATGPAWSPDGNMVAFQSRQSGQYNIWVINADGSNLKQLSNGTDDEVLAWSPDGKTIVYQSRQSSGHYALFTMNADGSNPTALTSDASADYEGARFSPDGKTLALYSNKTGHFQVFTMDLATKNITQVNSDSADEGRPTWRP
jgi:Tol biopolymer transport system component